MAVAELQVILLVENDRVVQAIFEEALASNLPDAVGWRPN
jgi:hypothetical protein